MASSDPFREAVQNMRRLQLEYAEASRSNSFRAELWTEKQAAERLVDKLLRTPPTGQASLF